MRQLAADATAVRPRWVVDCAMQLDASCWGHCCLGGEETTCLNNTRSPASTPRRCASSVDFGWLGVERQNAASACFVEVETDTGLKGHGITQHSDSRRGRGADQQCRAETSWPRSAQQRAHLACAVLDALGRRAGAICELGDLGARHRDLGHQGQGARRADLEAARRRARQGAGLRHHRRARRRHRAAVRSGAAAGGDGLQVPEDAGRPSRPRQPARPEADDRDRAQRRAPHQGAARGDRRRDRDRHRRAVPARPLARDGAGAADRALSRRLLRGAAGAERRAA